jgi:23S rRNA U2552 (ribose-2'-O)-methylase RlmE/FtsJ
MELVPPNPKPWTTFLLHNCCPCNQDEYPPYNPSWEGWKEIEHDTLNEFKDKIDALEKNGTWEMRKKLANPYELVYTNEDKKCPISLANAKPLSRSYFKMIEILDLVGFFTKFKKQHRIRSAHVCEGPGGFIQAFLEQATKKKDIEFVVAMTLKPTHAQIPGWKRAMQFLKKHPELKITYGEDGTGDIYNLENQANFIEALGGKKVELFTADGGFDFKMDYIHQEQIAFRLIVCSFAMGFQSLSPGGVCIIKLFDTFGKATQEFLGYISSYFKQSTLYKPAMSRPCNSERYFIGVGFLGASDHSTTLFNRLQKDLAEKSSKDLESIFVSSDCFSESMNHIQTFQKELEIHQVNVLQRAIEADLDKKYIYWNESYRRSEEWCQRFRINYKQIVVH